MIVVYTADRAEMLASQYEKMRWFTVQRVLLRVPTDRRSIGGLHLSRGPYARVYKKGRLHIVIQHEWIDGETVIL